MQINCIIFNVNEGGAIFGNIHDGLFSWTGQLGQLVKPWHGFTAVYCMTAVMTVSARISAFQYFPPFFHVTFNYEWMMV